MLEFRVTRREAGRIDPRLFGQFLERASFGEPGPEAFADPETGSLPEAVVSRLAEMRIPVVRFPGGSDVDRVDWRDMVDGVPGREGGRPLTRTPGGEITNRFGYDEYFRLRDRLGWETVVVCNLLDALLAPEDPEPAILASAGLVAYCNAPVGARLPDGMPDWPSVRARNGHAEPYGVEHVQIGNEIMFKLRHVREAKGLAGRGEAAAWYLRVIRRYVEVVREIDPDAGIIIDAQFGDGIERDVLADEFLRREVGAVTLHRYAPGQVGPVRRLEGGGRPVDADPRRLDAEDWWYACATMPAQLAPDGTARALTGEQYDLACRLGYRIVCTEWNWNGWGFEEADPRFRNERLPAARALGAAGFLHGLMRQCARVDLATQSMLVGHRWQIAAVQVDPSGRRPPHLSPQGLATTLYNLHHGERMLEVDHGPLPAQPQPYVIGKWTKWPEAAPNVAYVDLVATADERKVYVHVIQRHAGETLSARVDLTELGVTAAGGSHWTLSSRDAEERGRSGDPAPCGIDSRPVALTDGILLLDLPPRTAHIVEVPLPSRAGGRGAAARD